MSAITSKWTIPFSPGGMIIHICSRLRNPESPLSAIFSQQANMQSRRWNYYHGAHSQDEETEVNYLIKFTHLYTWIAKQKPRATALNLCVFAPHPLGVVGGDLAPMLRQKQAIFRHKLKKVRKTTRTFSYDLNKIPHDYIVEMKNRFMGLDLVSRRTMDGGL